MLYDPSKMTQLIQDLAQASSDLRKQAGELDSAASTLQSAWQDNQSLDGFLQSKRNWNTEFGDPNETNNPETTIGCMQALSDRVHEAMIAMQTMDAKIGDGMSV